MRKTGKDVHIDFIVSCLKLGEKRGEVLRKCEKKWGMTKSVYDRLVIIAKQKHAIESETIQNKIKEESVAGAIDALKSGLKSKLDRQLFYQNEIKVMEAQLRGEVKFTFKLGNSIKNSHAISKEGREIFMLPVEIQNDLRSTIKSYLSEISKMEGEYAATKTDITTKGESIKEKSIDLSKLSDEALRELANLTDTTSENTISEK